MKKLPPGPHHPETAPPQANKGTEGHATLAGKILNVFRVGGDNERSVGRHGHPPALPEERRSGPVQQQTISDGSGPVLLRAIDDSAAVTAVPVSLAEMSLRAGPQVAAEAAMPSAPEPIRLQTFSIDLAERLARTRAAQQQVLQELDQYDQSGVNLGKTVDRKR